VTTGRRLTVAERDALERDGYLLVASLLDGSAVDQLRAHLEALVAQEVAAGHANYGDPGTVEAGVVHAKLEPADPGFRPLCEHRLLADAAVAVLGGPWHMSGLGLRAPLAVTASFAPGDSPRLRLQISSLSGCRAAALTIRITALILGRSGRRFSGFPRVDLCCPALCGDTVGSAMGSIVDRDLRSRRGRFETISPCRRNAGQRGRRWPVTDRQHTWFTDRSGTQRARPAAAVSLSKCFGAEPS